MVKKKHPAPAQGGAPPSAQDPRTQKQLAATSANGRPRRKGGQAKENRARLSAELEGLRGATHDVVEQVSLRLSAELAEVARRVNAETLPGARALKIPGKTAARMLTAVQRLRLKPSKGRLRDLARIERTLDLLLELTAPKS